MADLKLRRDEGDESAAIDPRPDRADAAPARADAAHPDATGDEVIRATQETLDRLDRQMKNLRAIMGETFEGPDGPRAA